MRTLTNIKQQDTRIETGWYYLWIVMIIIAAMFAAGDAIGELIWTRQEWKIGDPYWGFHFLAILNIVLFFGVYFIEDDKAKNREWIFQVCTVASMLYGTFLIIKYWGTEEINILYWWPLVLGFGWLMTFFHQEPPDDDEDYI